MNYELEKYLFDDPDAYYEYNGEKYKQSVHGKSFVRYKKAKEQAQRDVVDVKIIINIIKNFLKNVGIKTIENPILKPRLIDYAKIKEEFGLENQKDIVWLKFTTDKYLGVVATSDDINFVIPQSNNDYDKKYRDKWLYNSSGIIVHKLNKMWDDSFVLVFPLRNIPQGYTRFEVEKAIGNLLIANEVPILDYYSHLY